MTCHARGRLGPAITGQSEAEWPRLTAANRSRMLALSAADAHFIAIVYSVGDSAPTSYGFFSRPALSRLVSAPTLHNPR